MKSPSTAKEPQAIEVVMANCTETATFRGYNPRVVEMQTLTLFSEEPPKTAANEDFGLFMDAGTFARYRTLVEP